MTRAGWAALVLTVRGLVVLRPADPYVVVQVVPAIGIVATNPAQLAVAEPIVAARIAATQRHADEAITLLTQAVAAEERLPYDEPAIWFFPARHLLGAQLLIAGHAAAAERVYRADLALHPANGWALYGLAAALSRQGEARAAARVMREFAAAWQRADVRLPGSAFWFAGPDTARCECERATSANRQSGGELPGLQHDAGVD